MAVFRVERTRDYTVMSNFHLKDMKLSLKAKGLLSMMLSLPETWNYTTRGLAAICKEGVDAIGSAVRELEAAGYITNVDAGRGLIKCGSAIVPFVNSFPKNTHLYRLMSTKFTENQAT